jgi:hypothetical protein
VEFQLIGSSTGLHLIPTIEVPGFQNAFLQPDMTDLGYRPQKSGLTSIRSLAMDQLRTYQSIPIATMSWTKVQELTLFWGSCCNARKRR